MFGIATELPPLEEISKIIDSHEKSIWDWALASTFTCHLAAAFLDSLKHTSPGKDKQHNFCYKYGGEHVMAFLVRLTDRFFNNERLPADINDGLFVFLPKGDKEDDKDVSSEGVYRSP